MLRAIIVNIGTVAGVSAALLYQPQSELLEFAGNAISSGSDTTIEQGSESNNSTNQDSNNQNPNSDNAQNSNSGHTSKKHKKNDGTPNPSSSSADPEPSSSSSNPDPTQSSSPTPTKSATPSPTPTKTKSPSPTPTPSATTKDGTYIGSRVDVIYSDGGTKRKSGTLKIQVIISGGKVSDIVWTEYPTGEHIKYTNRAYEKSAKPLIGLTVAELKAAKVATKTGATGTSTAFVTSLDSVLQQL